MSWLAWPECLSSPALGQHDSLCLLDVQRAGCLACLGFVDHPLLPIETQMGMEQVVSRMPLRHADKVSTVSLPGQPLVQLMLPTAQKLAAKAPGGTAVGAFEMTGFLA